METVKEHIKIYGTFEKIHIKYVEHVKEHLREHLLVIATFSLVNVFYVDHEIFSTVASCE